MLGLIVFISVFLTLVVVTLAIVIPISVINKKYTDFVLLHSTALKELENINSHYNFNKIKNHDLYHSYDNENYYDMISTRDYLIYQLVYMQKEVNRAMNDAYGNKIMFDKYKQDIAERCFLGKYDADQIPNNMNRLMKIEGKIFSKTTKSPQIQFNILVRLELTNLNDRYICSKQDFFGSNEIRSLISRINNKRNDFYLDEEIWKSIVRVERGKVSNKLRFYIYARDGHRCRMCGRYTDDLEIDHIIPISKGGKTVESNLQTLCRSCNIKKGNKVETYRSNYYR